MKLTVAGLRRLIKEEARKVLRENAGNNAEIISAIEELASGEGFEVTLSQTFPDDGEGGLRDGVEHIYLIDVERDGLLYVKEGERFPGEYYVNWIGYTLRGAPVEEVISFVERLGDVDFADLDKG
jgi:hypothetical protein